MRIDVSVSHWGHPGQLALATKWCLLSALEVK